MLNNYQKKQGQSLIELLVAMGIFVLFASAGCTSYTQERCWSCDKFTDADSCGPQTTDPQYGCSWEEAAWWWNLGNSADGYLSFTPCEWYVQ
ncbi:prepilin-type N-terminal cleavage/methylation domain-containing protein [bacterium]|nr:prepilin-type N-terminal cleavage/methylation domain-containing protein [bacterium]